MTSDQSLELLTCIAKSNSTVSTSLHRSIQQYTHNKEYNAKADGLDYLQVKNGIMISYLIDLTMLLRCKLNAGGDENKDVGEHCIKRLQEMKVALEKMRPLEKRMRYQIDKLLALSTLGAGTFAAVGQEEEEKDGSDDEASGMGGELDESDPLSFKPDLQGMMSMFQDDDEKQSANDSDGQSGDESEIEDEDNVTTEKDVKESGVYQPPRLQAMPFDFNEQIHEKEERQRQKQLARMQRSELAEVVRAQYTDAPEEEDIRGGAMLGKQREVSKRLAQREADVTEFEETHMIRLTMGKKEKNEKKRIMREEMSNLGAIADLGNVVAGVDDAFGDGTRGRGRKQDTGGHEKFVTRGMRKRKVEVLEPQSSRKGKPRTQNSFQKDLYGGKRSAGNSRRKR